MEHPEVPPPRPLENDSTPTASTSEVTSSQDPQIPVDNEAETAGDQAASTASRPDTQTPGDHVTQADADSGSQVVTSTAVENLQEGKGKWLYLFIFPHRLWILFERSEPP